MDPFGGVRRIHFMFRRFNTCSPSIVGAGSIVTKDVPDNCLVAGSPARVLRENLPQTRYGWGALSVDAAVKAAQDQASDVVAAAIEKPISGEEKAA